MVSLRRMIATRTPRKPRFVGNHAPTGDREPPDFGSREGIACIFGAFDGELRKSPANVAHPTRDRVGS